MKVNLEVEASDLKMLREALCLAQTLIAAYSNVPKYANTLQSLVNQIDLHRPLGSDGKHGNLHTTTCGCEDKTC